MYLSQDALDYVLSAKDELMDLERTLCAIPSPLPSGAPPGRLLQGMAGKGRGQGRLYR